MHDEQYRRESLCRFAMAGLVFSTLACQPAPPEGRDCSDYEGRWAELLDVDCQWELILVEAWEARVLVDIVFWERVAGLQPLGDALDVVGSIIEERTGELGDAVQLLLEPTEQETEVLIEFGCADHPGGVSIVMDLREPPLDGRGIPTEVVEF